MKKTYINILDGNLNDAIKIAQQIPEFYNLYLKEKFENRLKNTKHLILLANYKDKFGGNSCLLVAGKGHENYQTVKDKKLAFKDSRVIRSLLKN